MWGCQRLPGPSLTYSSSARKKLLGDTKSLGSLLRAVPQMLLCVSEGLKVPQPPVRTTVWISTPPALCGSHSFVHAACQGLLGDLAGGRGPTLPHEPSLSSLFPLLSCIEWFHPIVGFAPIVIYPLTSVSHGAGFYLFQEKIAEGICVLRCWEPALGARARKRASSGCSSERWHSNHARGCPRLHHQRCHRRRRDRLG